MNLRAPLCSLRFLSLAAALATAAFATACGGDDDGGSFDCASFAACGGDVVGEWDVVQLCVSDDPQTIEDCPDAVIDVVQDITGSVSMNDDMTYTMTLTSSGTIDATVPTSCLPDGFACEDIPDIDCTTEGANCECVDTFNETNTDGGTWSTSGNTLTLTSDAGISEIDYCVDGNQLTIQPDSTDNEFIIVFEK